MIFMVVAISMFGICSMRVQATSNKMKVISKEQIGEFEDEEYEEVPVLYSNTDSNIGTIKSGKATVSASDDKELGQFVYDGSSIIFTKIEANISNLKNAKYAKEKDIRFSVYDEKTYKEVDYIEGISDDYLAWTYLDNKELKKGHTYVVCVENNSKYKYNIKYKIKGYEKYTKKFKVNNGNTIKVKSRNRYYFYNLNALENNALAYVSSCSSSDKKIAEAKSFGDEIAINAKKRGNCTITIKLVGGATEKIKVKVLNGNPQLDYTDYTLNLGQSFKNKIYYNDKKVTWSSTNKKIAKVSSSGKVTAVGIGTCYIKAKVDRKTLKCKVIVKRREPNFGAVLWDYNTRDNYFSVEIRNKGPKTLTINSGIKVEDKDYKTYDRRVYLKKKVSIKTNTTKSVRFYVKGGLTWPDYSDFTLFYKFTYDGKTYESHVWYDDSVYKKGKKWYGTYWDEDWYNRWANPEWYDD